MISFKEFSSIVEKNFVLNKILVVPIYKEIVVDTETAVSLFLKTASEEKFSYLLESAETNLQWGRYSFISYSPYLLFSSKQKKIKIVKNKKVKAYNSQPFDEIKKILKQFYIPESETKSLPRFFGGLVGYISYENVHLIEETVKLPQKDEFNEVWDIYLMFNQVVLILDHYLNKLKIIYLVIVEDKSNLEELYLNAEKEINKVEENIKTKLLSTKNFFISQRKINIEKYESNIEEKKFINIVEKAKRYISEGEIIQVVLSRRLYRQTLAEMFDVYRTLRIINPSPYMFYLKFRNLILIGSSPEILVRKQQDIIETRPIAGTRPRGKTEEEHNMYEKELLSSKKENAEHIMLVDLARNDIGKIAKYNSINLPQFKIIEKFSHVMHIVSSVKGIIKKNFDCVDVLKSCFPAGTVCGAPKVRAMQIISELERYTRGPYAGAVGYFSLNGNMDMAITIRTIVYKDKKVYIQSGAGIVADSVAEKEFEETINKAKALILAVDTAESNSK
ncbi:MAG: anthranilate synthase component I [Endomicrobiia bacterium]